MPKLDTQKIGSQPENLTDDSPLNPSLPPSDDDKRPKSGKGKPDRKPIGGNKDGLISGDENDNILVGRNGKDRMDGNGGNDKLDGGNGNDQLSGGEGDDELIGGNGKDTLVGGNGIDRLTGGRGKDRFVFNDLQEAGDTITDFRAEDVLDLRGIFATQGVTGLDPAARFQQLVKLEQVGANTNVLVDTDGTGVGTAFTQVAVLNNVTATNLTVANFGLA